MSGAAIDRFYRLVFSDAADFRKWSARIVEFASALREVVPVRPELRPVIFVPLYPAPGAPPYAYLSPGARGLGIHLSAGAAIDLTPVGVAELPPGLTMLYGDEVDAAEYVKRHPQRSGD